MWRDRICDWFLSSFRLWAIYRAILQNDAALADAIAIILEKKATFCSTTNNIPQAVHENKAQVIGQMYNSKAKNIGLLTLKDWQVLLLDD